MARFLRVYRVYVHTRGPFRVYVTIIVYFLDRCICARVDVFVSKSLYSACVLKYVFVYESICVSVFMEVSVFTCVLLYNICVYMYMFLFVIISRAGYKRVYLCVCLQICLCESSRAKALFVLRTCILSRARGSVRTCKCECKDMCM